MAKQTRKQRKLNGVRNTKTLKGSGKKIDTTDPITRLPENFLELVPPHNLPEVDGIVRLYHFTQPFYLEAILRYGIAVGDVVAADISLGWNAPNLTANRFFHNPANRNAEIVKIDYLRLEITLDASDEKIVPMDWFDQKFANSNTLGAIKSGLERGVDNGTLNEQYLYKGAVPPSAITNISKWNAKTQFWDRLSKTEIRELCQKEMPDKGITTVVLVGNYIDNDWTGGVAEEAIKFQHREHPYRGLYKLANLTLRQMSISEKRKFRKSAYDDIGVPFWDLYLVVCYFAGKHKRELVKSGVEFVTNSRALDLLLAGEPVALDERIKIMEIT